MLRSPKSYHFFPLYSLIQMKCQGGNKCALPLTVKIYQPTRRFGRISFACLFKLTKHIALSFYLMLPHLLLCMRGTRNVRKILFCRFKEGSCHLLAKYVHLVLINRLRGLSMPRNSVVKGLDFVLYRLTHPSTPTPI